MPQATQAREGEMAKKKKRDIEKGYGRAAFAAKLRRLADSIETGRRFSIQIAGERIQVPAGAIFMSSTNARRRTRRSNSS